MFDLFLGHIIQLGNQLPTEIVSGFCLIFALTGLFLFAKHSGLYGLYIYNSLIVCLANFQILQLAQYHFWPSPIPLGTVLFTTLFLTNTIITEHYGEKAARKGVALSLWGYAFVCCSMVLSLAHAPASDAHSADFSSYTHQNYQALLRIFVPSCRLLLSGLIASCISQLTAIWLFSRIAILTRSSVLKQSGSMFLSSIVDHIVFSFCAFYLFTTDRPSWRILIDGYIIGSYIIRIIVIIACVLVGRILPHYLPKKQQNAQNIPD